jgi:hypothetical protein
MRAELGSEVAIADGVAAAESVVDLSRPGVGLSDRLDVGGSAVSRRRAAEIPDSDIRAVCLQLALSADQLAGSATRQADPEILVRQIRRRRVVKKLLAGGNVYATAPSTTVFAPSSALHPAVATPIDFSGISDHRSPDAEIERGRTFERRADELISLLLAGSGDRRMLRDVLYTHDQIAEHPQLRTVARTASAGMDIRGGVDAGGRDVAFDPGAEGMSVPASPRLYGEQRSIR